MDGIVQSWGRILAGYTPSLSIEITRECPLRCPGCYAYGSEHLGGGVTLREVSDFKGQALIEGVVGLVEKHRPVHVSLVGGEPLVRFRELDVLLPRLSQMGLHVQVVTSAVRTIPIEWARIPRLSIVVSIDGLQPEHDVRRAPATYDRVLKHIVGHQIVVHCSWWGDPGTCASSPRSGRRSRMCARSGSASTLRRWARNPTRSCARRIGSKSSPNCVRCGWITRRCRCRRG